MKNLFHLDGGSPKIYAEMVTRLDAGIGRILAALDDSGLADDTLIVFTSDNGGERFSDMWPFTGSKGGVYEGSHRVPAIIRYPGVLPEGKVSEQVAPADARRLNAAWEAWNKTGLPELPPRAGG